MVIPGGESSLDFAAFIFGEERNGKVFSLDDLLVINELYYDRRIDALSAGKLIQKGTAEGRRVLEHLHELGLVEARGERSGRVVSPAQALLDCAGLGYGGRDLTLKLVEIYGGL